MHSYFGQEKQGRLINVIFVSLLIILGFFAYRDSLGGDFLWDDSCLIGNNALIRSTSNVLNAFLRPLHIKFPGYYRPLQNISYIVDYRLWGMNPFGYHLTGVIVHLFNAILIYFLLNLIFKNRTISFFSASVFTVHTLLSEPVNYISSRSNLLVTGFIVLSFIFYLRHNNDRRKQYYLFISALFFTFALLSNEIAIIFPAMLATYCFLARKHVRSIVPYVFLAAIYVLVKIKIAPVTLLANNTHGIAILANFLAMSLSLTVMPLGLHKNWNLAEIVNMGAWEVLTINAIFVFLLVMSLITNKKAFFGIVWFLVSLFSVVVFALTRKIILSEGWFYFSFIGLCIAIAAYLSFAFKYKALKYVSIGALIILVAFYSSLTVGRCRIWSDGVKFYKELLVRDGRNDKIWSNLGMYLLEKSNLKDAIESFDIALSINPKNSVALNGIGVIYYEQRDFDNALGMFLKALTIYPCSTESLHNIANIYMIRNDTNKAIEFYEKAVKCMPDSVLSLYNLLVLYAKCGNDEKALDILMKHPGIESWPGRAP